MNTTNPAHVGISAAGMNDPTLTHFGMGMMGNYNSTEVMLGGSQECGSLTELSQADLKGLVGETPEEEDPFTNINESVLELETIFADINNQVKRKTQSDGIGNIGAQKLASRVSLAGLLWVTYCYYVLYYITITILHGLLLLCR